MQTTKKLQWNTFNNDAKAYDWGFRDQKILDAALDTEFTVQQQREQLERHGIRVLDYTEEYYHGVTDWRLTAQASDSAWDSITLHPFVDVEVYSNTSTTNGSTSTSRLLRDYLNGLDKDATDESK